MLRYNWLKLLGVLILIFIWANSSLAQTGLGDALSTARVRVIVTDVPGGQLVNGAFVNIVYMSGNVQCSICSGTTENNLPLQFTLTEVSATGDEIDIEVSGVPGFDPVTETVSIVAFATVDVEIALISESQLSVQVTGNGKGFVTSSPVGIDCGIHADETVGLVCSAGYIIGTQVTLMASPAGNSVFTGWSGGGCSGNGLCIVAMNQARTVTATFTSDDCNYSISPTSCQFAASGGAGIIEVVASTGCTWNAFESSDWITITAGSSGIGVGTVNYTVSTNTGASSRTATITVAGISHTVSQAPIAAIEVDIDIMPGSYPNSINLKSNGVVPVAILSTIDFAATAVDLDTVLFADAFPVKWAIKDVNQDGNMDLLLIFRTQDLNLTLDSTEATLTGKTMDGTAITGTDTANIVPQKKK